MIGSLIRLLESYQLLLTLETQVTVMIATSMAHLLLRVTEVAINCTMMISLLPLRATCQIKRHLSS